MKKRIFIANDVSYIDTGYGVYGKELLTRLHNTGKYEIAELGCYATVENPNNKNIPWKLYPNAVSITDERTTAFKSNNLNQFGLWRFNKAVLDFKPHIVFDIRDYWMFSYQEISPFRPYFNWVVMPATDSSPPKIDWLYTYANADMIVPYTQWAYNTLSKYGKNKFNIFPKIANAGINPNEFTILDNKQQLKKQYLNLENASVTGLVMRNQKRKLIADIFLVYRKYLERLKETNQIDLYNRSILYLHTTFPEENGWDLPALLMEYNLMDKVYFTYACKNCSHFEASKYQGTARICSKCQKRGSYFTSPTNGVKTESLNIIYNLFDLYIQYAICEGFGMPQVEAAACGIQIASVNYSAMTEICERVHGIKIPVQTLFRELETNADRAYPDNNATIDLLYQFFVNTPDNIKIHNSKKIREACINYYTWDKVFQVWDECFDSIDITTKRDWNSKDIHTTNHEEAKVPSQLNNKEFVEYICSNIINEPSLVDTATIQTMIKDLDMGVVCRNNAATVFDRKQAMETLNTVLSNKVGAEKLRTNPTLIPKEDFISK